MSPKKPRKKSRSKIEKLHCQLCMETLSESSNVYRCANNHLFCTECSGSNTKKPSKKKVISQICSICSEPFQEQAKNVIPVVYLDTKDSLQNQCILKEQVKKFMPVVDLDAKDSLRAFDPPWVDGSDPLQKKQGTLQEQDKIVIPVVDLDAKDPLPNQSTLQEQAKKVIPVVDLDTKHPLQNQWTLWYFSKDFKVTNWEDKQKEVIIFSFF